MNLIKPNFVLEYILELEGHSEKRLSFMSTVLFHVRHNTTKAIRTILQQHSKAIKPINTAIQYRHPATGPSTKTASTQQQHTYRLVNQATKATVTRRVARPSNTKSSFHNPRASRRRENKSRFRRSYTKVNRFEADFTTS